MIVLYPGLGLGATDRPRIAYTLGYQPVSVFVWFEAWIYLEGREPPPPRLMGLEEVAPLSGRAMVSLAGATSSMSRAGVAPPALGARDPSPPLAAEEPSAPLSTPRRGARLSAPDSSRVLAGKRKPPKRGKEYDDEIEGKERGWLKK